MMGVMYTTTAVGLRPLLRDLRDPRRFAPVVADLLR